MNEYCVLKFFCIVNLANFLGNHPNTQIQELNKSDFSAQIKSSDCV
jgi:hypothetical protein